MRRGLIAAAIAGAVVVPALAGETAGPVDLSAAGLPPPADTGKPQIRAPSPLPQQHDGDCLAPLPCGARLLGTVQKNGAVELQVPALRW